MKISVCLPVRNAERTLQKAIHSVLVQSFEDFELLIIDDGSEDRTNEVIKEFRDVRIKVVYDVQQIGIAARLNQMIAMAQGEYIARMDADDILMPVRLEKQLKFLENNEHIDVVSSSAIVIDENGERLGIRNDILIHPTVMGRTEWFRQNPYNESYSGVEDYELWLRVKDKTNFSHISEPLMYYRERTHYNVQKVWRERILGIKMIWRERHLYGSTWRALLQIANNIMVMVAVPIVHALHLDSWVISRRNKNLTN